jgi:uncharacterized protein YcnI
MIKRLRNYSALFTILALLVPALASAHVIVTPSQAGIGQELVFNVSSPNEQQTPIIQVTLDIPSGISDVVPTQKDGWAINTTASSITWSGGQIPVGQRADFSFGAQVPGQPVTLDWKAYQTYADGTVVHWDQQPNGKSDDASGNAGPFSVTKVVNDLTPTTSSSSNTLPLAIACLALVISVAAILRPNNRRST